MSSYIKRYAERAEACPSSTTTGTGALMVTSDLLPFCVPGLLLNTHGQCYNFGLVSKKNKEYSVVADAMNRSQKNLAIRRLVAMKAPRATCCEIIWQFKVNSHYPGSYFFQFHSFGL